MMSERDAMWREDLVDGCRGVNFNLRFIVKAVREIRTMPSDFHPPVLDELAETENALTEALLAVKLTRSELSKKPRVPSAVAAE